MEECYTKDDAARKTPFEASSTNETSELDIIIHPVVDLPIPYGIDYKDNEIIFLDPSIGEGKRLITDKSTSISHLFSILRQFIRPVCHSIGYIVDEMLKRGVSINDVDATTGMSILHYAVRATALSEKRGLVIVKRLLANGADPRQRCLFSGMNALHIAVYFDIASVVKLLLKPCDLWPLVDVNSLCDGFDFGTALHIAASCLSVKVVEALLQRGAKPFIQDDLDRTPIECLPTNFTSEEEHKRAKQMKAILSKYGVTDSGKQDSAHANGLTIGTRVVVSYNETVERDKSVNVVRRTGTLRFIGKLPKSTDVWAGVEIDTPNGQNSGEIGKTVYFTCKKNHGIFVRLSMVHALTSRKKPAKTVPNRGATKCPFKLGDVVLVAETMKGVVRFIGETQFASGIWCGVELDTAGPGRNNGSVGDVSYFACPAAKGVFSPPSKLKLIDTEESIHPSGDSLMSVRERSSRKRSPRVRTDRGILKTTSASNASYPLSTRTRRLRFEDRNPELEPSLCLDKAKDPEITHSYLHPGMRVDVCGTERSGIIKFVGETEFAAGVWVGLDLGVPQGRNDGSVRGHRYFRCHPLHGLMVRPHRVACNGVSGGTLLPPDYKHHRSSET